MKAIYELVTQKTESSFLARRFSLPKFDGPYHFHPEIELTYIERSSGTRYIGGKVSDYKPGDMVLLGKDVPHCWHGVTESKYSESIVIQFRREFLGEAFWNLDELTAVRILLEKANSGIHISGKTRDAVANRMLSCIKAEGIYKILYLIEILHLIALSNETTILDEQFQHFVASGSDTARFQHVFSYIIENYRQNIKLSDVAGIACLTPTAFCRYFRKITNKTLTEVITEYRIKNACQLLRHTERPVADICFESGFGNLSHFTRNFKSIVQKSPLTYRKSFNSQKSPD